MIQQALDLRPDCADANDGAPGVEDAGDQITELSDNAAMDQD